MTKKQKNKKTDKSIKETLEVSPSGEYFTPKCIVDHIVKIMEQSKGSICDPACGPGRLLMQAEEFIKESIKDKNDKRKRY